MYKSDYYSTLDLSSTATPDEVKRAFRVAAKKYHPDVSRESNAEEMFKRCYEAYEILSDPIKRSRYDSIFASTADDSQQPQYQQWQNEARAHAEEYAHYSYEQLVKTLFAGGKFAATIAGGCIMAWVEATLKCFLIFGSIYLVVSTYGLILLVIPLIYYFTKYYKVK